MIEIRNLCKTFVTTDGQVEALHDVNLTVRDGDIYGIIGMSGAGKSTLVRCLNMLERPTAGTVVIDGAEMGALSPKELRIKRREITMIFQQFNLLMQKTCLKNVCFPMEIAGVPHERAVQRARELLELVGLPDKANAYPAQLSGGQKQRIAIARALATNPRVLLCDEATSALDPNTTHAILRLIRDIHHKLGITVVVITHQMSVIEEICNRVAILDGGKVAEEGLVSEVFSRPQSDAARRLVSPEETDGDGSSASGRRIRVVFHGADTIDQPLIATLAKEHGLMLSILSASTRSIDDKVYGSMLLRVPDEDGATETALRYLREIPDILAEEV